MLIIMFNGFSCYGDDYYEIKELNNGKQKTLATWSIDSKKQIANLQTDLTNSEIDLMPLFDFFKYKRTIYGDDFRLTIIFRQSTIELEFFTDNYITDNTFWKGSNEYDKTESKVRPELWEQFQDMIIYNYLKA